MQTSIVEQHHAAMTQSTLIPSDIHLEVALELILLYKLK